MISWRRVLINHPHVRHNQEYIMVMSDIIKNRGSQKSNIKRDEAGYSFLTFLFTIRMFQERFHLLYVFSVGVRVI